MARRRPHAGPRTEEPLRRRAAPPGLRRAGAMDPWDRAAPTAPHAVRRSRRAQLAVPADRRLRVPVGLPHRRRSSRPTARSSGCARRASTRRACSRRSSTAAPGGFRLGPTGMGVPAGRRYEPGTNVLETTWQTPTGWAVVREALIIGRWREREAGSATAHTRPPTDHDAYHVLVRTIECFHGLGPGRAAVRADVRLRAHAGEWSPVEGDPRPSTPTAPGRSRCACTSDLRLGIEGGVGARPPPAREGRAALLRAVVVAAARRPADLRARPSMQPRA